LKKEKDKVIEIENSYRSDMIQYYNYEVVKFID